MKIEKFYKDCWGNIMKKRRKSQKACIKKIREIVIKDPLFIGRWLEELAPKKIHRCKCLKNQPLMITTTCFNKVYKYQSKYSECSSCPIITEYAIAMFDFFENENGENL